MIHGILMLGQSNMVGAGHVDEVEPIDSERLSVFRCGRWREWFIPVSFDGSGCGTTLAESFAAAYRDDHPEADRVGLIPCAQGGTRIDQWRPGGLLYDNAVATARLAQRTGNIVAVLWHQGESDCGEERRAVYAKKVLAVLRSIRRDLGLENVPLLIGELGQYLKDRPKSAAGYQTINKALRAAAETLPCAALVPSEGLTANADLLHFNSRSLREFGLRYYAAFRRLEDKNRIWPEKPTMAELEGPDWPDFPKENP